MDYSIVIPTYNEAGRITSTLTTIANFMKSFCASYEILVVDDGSTDTTLTVLTEFTRDNPEVVVIKNPHKGKGFAVYSGVKAAQGDLIYMCDADLSAPISELKKLSVWVTDQGYDVVIASREGPGSVRIGEPLYRHLMGRVFNMWVQLLALPGIHDSQCGFKVFKKSAAKEIFQRLKIYGEDSQNLPRAYLGAFDVEVLYIARKLRYRIREVPVTWTFVKTTRLNPIESSIKMALDVVKVRLNDLRRVYTS